MVATVMFIWVFIGLVKLKAEAEDREDRLDAIRIATDDSEIERLVEKTIENLR